MLDKALPGFDLFEVLSGVLTRVSKVLRKCSSRESSRYANTRGRHFSQSETQSDHLISMTGADVGKVGHGL